MAKLSYSDTLKNPLWQKKRLEILSRDKFTCQLGYSFSSLITLFEVAKKLI